MSVSVSVPVSASYVSPCDTQQELDQTGEFSPEIEVSILDNLPVALLQLDTDGVISNANQAAKKCLGVSLHGKLWRDVYRLVFHRFDQGDLRSIDGTLYSISTAPIAGSDGQIIMLTDITETRRLQKQAARESRLVALGEMVARLAHQVRTPLSAAMLYLGQMQRASAQGEPVNPQRHAYIVQRLHERLHHIETMVQDMLMFTQTRTRASVDIDMQALIGSLHQQFDELFTYRAGALSSQVCPKTYLQGNPIALSSALGNLLCNALDVVDSGAQVHIDVSQVDTAHPSNHTGQPAVCIEIHDNGPGIDESVCDSVFEPFFTTKSDGNGLGLPVVKTVVENHSGTINIERSERLNGACFTIMLPIFKRNDEST